MDQSTVAPPNLDSCCANLCHLGNKVGVTPRCSQVPHVIGFSHGALGERHTVHNHVYEGSTPHTSLGVVLVFDGLQDSGSRVGVWVQDFVKSAGSRGLVLVEGSGSKFKGRDFGFGFRVFSRRCVKRRL
jgi:hypothetical protein